MNTNIDNKSEVKSIKSVSKRGTGLRKVDSRSKTSVKTMGKKCEPIVVSGEKPNILANCEKRRLRKQSFEEQLYCKEVSDNSHESDSTHCYICDQKFETKTILSEHMKMSHNLIESIEESLPFPELVESHCNSEGRIKCGKCRFQTDSEGEMILHSVNHSFTTDDSKTSLRLKCPTCKQCFSKLLLRKHVYIHTSEKPFKCKTCDKEFTRRQSLVLHEKRHFPEKAVFKCEFCGLSFITDRGYKKHLKTHTTDREKSHSCDVCGASFFDKESLKAHTIRIHLPKNTRRFKCEFEGCRYMTLYHHQLLEHQRTHSDDKPFACDQCEYTAKSKWSYRKHYRRHTKEKPFKCQVCDYSSSLCSNLTRHMRIHTGSKPFKCPFCSYSCNNHENLRKHVLKSKKHEGRHLYNCKHCMFATNSFSELRQHLELNHNDIYSVEQIDRMISSFYHKNEDNITDITPNESTDETIKEQNSSLENKTHSNQSNEDTFKTIDSNEDIKFVVIEPNDQ